MNKSISVIGGDSRIIELIKLFTNEDYKVYTYGLEKADLENKNIIKSNNINELFVNSKMIIGPTPLSNNEKTVFAPFAEKEINIEDIFKNLNSNNIFIAGKIMEPIKSMLSRVNVTYIDIIEREELSILNAIATAEGAIECAMKNTNITIHGSNCLILGFGRIGKVLAKMLKGIGANVWCEARKNSDISWIRAYGYNPLHLTDLNKKLNNMDIIFNTIPSLVLDEEKLRLLNEDCLIIDLASKPGGVDFEKARELNLNVFWELAIPGKVASKTSAEYIKNTIDNVINEVGIS